MEVTVFVFVSLERSSCRWQAVWFNSSRLRLGGRRGGCWARCGWRDRQQRLIGSNNSSIRWDLQRTPRGRSGANRPCQSALFVKMVDLQPDLSVALYSVYDGRAEALVTQPTPEPPPGPERALFCWGASARFVCTCLTRRKPRRAHRHGGESVSHVCQFLGLLIETNGNVHCFTLEPPRADLMFVGRSVHCTRTAQCVA